MLSDDIRQKIVDWFYLEVQGGTSEDVYGLFDKMIDEGVLEQEFFDAHDGNICTLVDSLWFTCQGCGWTMPIEEQDERGDWHCKQCMDEEHGYDD